jgi:hypothetical protein
VDVGRQAVGFVERTDANEADSVAGSSVVAPNSNAATRTAGDLLALATVGRGVDDLNFSLEYLHTIGFNQRVQGKGCAGLPLAPTAMAAMDEQRPCRHAIAHETTSAAAVERCGFGLHRSFLGANLRFPPRGALIIKYQRDSRSGTSGLLCSLGVIVPRCFWHLADNFSHTLT